MRPPPTRQETPRIFVEESSQEDSSSESDDDDDDQDKRIDPDWKKTPLFKRIRQITRGRRTISKFYDSSDTSSKSEQEDSETGGVKRTSAGDTRCGCSKDCSSKVCRCRKNGGKCSTSCTCNVFKCINRSTANTSNESSPSNVSF